MYKKESWKKYYENNKEKESERKKIWYQKNRDRLLKKHKEYWKKYYENNKEKKAEAWKKWYLKNIEKRKMYLKKYYLKKKGMIDCE